MNYQRLVGIICWLALLCPPAHSQAVLTTLPLPVTAACPGSTVDVRFIRPDDIYTTAATTYAVQIASGDDYFDIPTSKTMNSSGGLSVTLPKSLAPGGTYSVRMTMKNPDYTGTPSLTRLIIKGQATTPSPPLVDSLNVDCMSTNRSSMAGLYADIFFRLAPGATPRLYYNEPGGSFTDYAEFPYQTKLPSGEYVRDKQHGYFQLNKTGSTSTTYVYPVSEHVYYLSQLIDGCESEPVASKLRILWKAGGGPGVINPMQYNYLYGQVVYCQGEQAFPLNVNGHRPPPENYQVAYWLGDPLDQPTPTRTFIPPTPDTSQPGYTTYSMNLFPIDYSKGCGNDNLLTYTHVKVTVTPTPTKPIAATGLIEYYQGQPSAPLSASTTDSTATLVWYGTNATGGTSSVAAPLPPTDQSGEFTYYVAQKVGTCEGARTALTIRINPLLGLDDSWLETHSQVYPNPVNAWLTVQVSGVSVQHPAKLEIVDLTGRSLQKYTSQQETSVLSLDRYASGSYYLRIQMDNKQLVKRIVKL
ncbi:T9SS type A sorting domain-containing protein [Spirosoma sp. KCTC 42546]|uniref:T9SS type A sorting domain-containing protein n=1 Tax=Spirosoma sp. KCTC 42546 TaxID=2520506 RepID=UPI00115A1A34|nr:T9SS type A sorting domain-containing protein [Spirosoma sp. KCTC 42546]QDK81295.1 T9SS type A sorting domain-containing protein [Spirosoma sp. KCTC 42546]